MHLRALAAALLIMIQPAPSRADDYGTLNPDDAGRDMLLRKIDMGARDTVTCSLAFNSTKYDDHDRARNIARVCAEAGAVGQFNYGVDLLRGFGVTGDIALGRVYVDKAARQGLDIAGELVETEYDLKSVLPDLQ